MGSRIVAQNCDLHEDIGGLSPIGDTIIHVIGQRCFLTVSRWRQDKLNPVWVLRTDWLLQSSDGSMLTMESLLVTDARDYDPGLDGLEALSYGDLKCLWQCDFGSSPPKGLSRRLLIYALAYEAQCRLYGRLSKDLHKQIDALGHPVPVSRKSLSLTPGTRLMREWHGMVHIVDVTVDGFVWKGVSYKSLSAIAREITGTRWNGLLFFGLKKRADQNPKRSKNKHKKESLISPHAKRHNNTAKQSLLDAAT